MKAYRIDGLPEKPDINPIKVAYDLRDTQLNFLQELKDTL